MADSAASRLDRAMRARSLELRKRWVQIAKEADITTSALGAIRRGEYRPSPHTAKALERALEWEPGSIESILDGGNPAPVPARSGQAVDSAAEWDEIARLIAEYRRLVAEIIDRVPDRNRASVGAAADLTVSLVEESTSTDRSK